MCARAVSVFHHGPYVGTSGAEEESLFAIWKWINKQAIYGSAFEPPFAQSYFNWLFYWAYGAFSLTVLSVAKLNSLALPVIARCLTLALTAISMLVVYHLLSPLSLSRRIAGSAVVAFNPLIGFWALTARPDMGALACGLVGVWCIKKSERSHSSGWICVAFLAFYCSWAFKQTYMAALVATVLHFCLARRWRPALWFGGATVLAVGLTFMFGTPEYRYAAIWSQSHMGLSGSIAELNLGRAILKAPLLLFGSVSAIGCIRRERANLLALWAIISIPLMLAASAKVGASDNYFFEPAAICSILFLLEWRHITAASVAQIASVVLIFSGLAGVVSLKPQPEFALLKSELAKMNGSVLVTDNWGNLPWFQERQPHFVLATTYLADRAMGKAFAFGGVGGMVQSGRIDFVVCPREKVGEPFDGIVPASLRKIKEDSKWAYFATQPLNQRGER
jgi:hypothetical protein